MAKKIVINNGMVQQTKAHLTNLFKPTNNPFNDRPVAEGGLDLNQFALQYYAGPNTNNPVATIYNKKNIVTNLFLCTENFVTFIDRINEVLKEDTLSRVMTKVTYTKDSVTGYLTNGTVDAAAAALLLPLVQGPTANKGAHFANYENMFAKNGLWGTTDAGVGSTHIPELFLRYLYSTDAAKRNIAFQIAELYYGIDNNMCTAANIGFIPAKDFNSNQFTITENGSEITLEYPNPIEFFPHYDERINNTMNKNLYLYFPFITTNAQRPGANRGEINNNEDGYISIYTGPTSAFQINATVNSTMVPTAIFANNSFSHIAKQSVTIPPAYGTFTANADMPVLTNTVWSVRKNKWVNQAGYTVIHITETGGGGDVTFDHTDKIDFIDSLKFIIKAPRVFS